MSNARPIATIDCETDPFKYGRMPEPFIWGYYDGANFKIYNHVENLIADTYYTEQIMYAHNGGRFDFHFMADYIPTGTDLFVINGRLVEFKIGRATFRDSYSLIPIALAQYEKTKIDYSKLEREKRGLFNDEIVAYLKSDCVNLFNLVSQFRDEFGKRAKTLASASMGVWSKLNGRVEKTCKYFYSVFKPFYHGGRTEARYIGEIKDNFNIFDINSAYPFAMMNEHPFGMEFEHNVDRNVDFEPQGFYTIDATSKGALSYYIDDKLTFPIGRQNYSATGWEIIAGIETGTLQIHRVIESYTLKQRICFAPFVQEFYSRKQKAIKGSPSYIFAKLMLNSLYGKFGANPENYWHYKVANVALAKQLEPDGWQLSGYFGKHLLIAKRLTEIEGRYYNVATAASITGFVRAYLWRAICEVKDALYCDTDSIVTRETLPCSNSLGSWDKEAECTYGAVAGKKLYAFRTLENVWKTSSKGVRLTAQQIIRIARGERIRWQQDAPTFSLHKPPSFLARNVALAGS